MTPNTTTFTVVAVILLQFVCNKCIISPPLQLATHRLLFSARTRDASLYACAHAVLPHTHRGP
jgi:hypothetical protein